MFPHNVLKAEYIFREFLKKSGHPMDVQTPFKLKPWSGGPQIFHGTGTEAGYG